MINTNEKKRKKWPANCHYFEEENKFNIIKNEKKKHYFLL